MPWAWAERLGRAWVLGAILGAYLILATIYNVIVPPFEAPDEHNHFFYVKHLADGNSLPVQDPERIGPWAQEGSQPPLYYALAALLIRGIDTDDIDKLLW